LAKVLASHSLVLLQAQVLELVVVVLVEAKQLVLVQAKVSYFQAF
jgi:hypothetical protein